MALTQTEIQELLRQVSLTREREIDCGECLSRAAEILERQLAGQDLPSDLEPVLHHLELCNECREEAEALRRALDEPASQT